MAPYPIQLIGLASFCLILDLNFWSLPLLSHIVYFLFSFSGFIEGSRALCNVNVSIFLLQLRSIAQEAIVGRLKNSLLINLVSRIRFLPMCVRSNRNHNIYCVIPVN